MIGDTVARVLAALIPPGACALRQAELGPVSPTDLHRLIERHRDEWLLLPGVRGVGGAVCGDTGWLMVYADRPVPGIPAEVDGIRVVVEVREPFQDIEGYGGRLGAAHYPGDGCDHEGASA